MAEYLEKARLRRLKAAHLEVTPEGNLVTVSSTESLGSPNSTASPGVDTGVGPFFSSS